MPFHRLGKEQQSAFRQLEAALRARRRADERLASTEAQFQLYDVISTGLDPSQPADASLLALLAGRRAACYAVSGNLPRARKWAERRIQGAARAVGLADGQPR
jgi:hypothetical protein